MFFYSVLTLLFLAVLGATFRTNLILGVSLANTSSGLSNKFIREKIQTLTRLHLVSVLLDFNTVVVVQVLIGVLPTAFAYD